MCMFGDALHPQNLYRWHSFPFLVGLSSCLGSRPSTASGSSPGLSLVEALLSRGSLQSPSVQPSPLQCALVLSPDAPRADCLSAGASGGPRPGAYARLFMCVFDAVCPALSFIVCLEYMYGSKLSLNNLVFTICISCSMPGQ